MSDFDVYFREGRQMVVHRKFPCINSGTNTYCVDVSVMAWVSGVSKVVAVFKAGATRVEVPVIDKRGEIEIPQKVLSEENKVLYIGIYGADSNGHIIASSEFKDLATILPGATKETELASGLFPPDPVEPDDEAAPESPDTESGTTGSTEDGGTAEDASGDTENEGNGNPADGEDPDPSDSDPTPGDGDAV